MTRRAGHILIVASEFPPLVHAGGLGTHLAELATGLLALGRRVTVCLPAPRELAARVDGPVRVIAMPPGTGTSHPLVERLPWPLPGVAATLRRGALLHTTANATCAALAADPPDVVHVHDQAQAEIAILLSRKLKAPLVTTFHIVFHPTLARHFPGGVPAPIRRRERRLCRASDMVIAVCGANRDLVMTQHGVPRFRTRVVPNGLDTARWSRRPDEVLTAIRARYARPDERIVICAGRVSRQKGILELLAAADVVIALYPAVRLLVVGRVGDFLPDARGFEGALQDTLARLPDVAARMTFVGKIGRDELAALYHVADLAVIPSTWESSSYAALEAMAAGVPVVASDVGGLKELVRHGVDGLLVPMNQVAGGAVIDVPALAAAQLRLLNDTLWARALGRAAQTRVQEDLSSAVMVRKTVLVYDDVVAVTARAGRRRREWS